MQLIVGGHKRTSVIEAHSPGQFFRTIIDEDGTLALAIGTTKSPTQPKAKSAQNSALLIGTIANGIPTTYQLIGG